MAGWRRGGRGVLGSGVALLSGVLESGWMRGVGWRCGWVTRAAAASRAKIHVWNRRLSRKVVYARRLGRGQGFSAMHHSADLIVDVGMCDGTDTAYYLSKGYRVVAVEADPILCDKASQRFAREIAEDKLTILNVGIAQSDEVMTFYRNVADPGGSTFNATLCNPDIVYEEVKVHCLPLSSVIKKYGVPYYLKIDIEGFDEIAVSSLTSSLAPKYISVELNFCALPAF